MISFLRTWFLALAFGSSFHDAKIINCGVDTSLLKLTDLALTPDPPVSGSPIDMTVKFLNPGDPITDGTVTTSITLNFIPFTPSTEPLCTNTKCPLVSGANDRSTSSTWPDSIQGKVVSKIVWTTPTGAELLCIQTTVTAGSEENTTSRLRGSTTVYNETSAKLITSLFRKKLSNYRKNTTSYALIQYVPNRKRSTKPSLSNSTCKVSKRFWQEPEPTKDLALWNPKSNALRFSSF